MQQQEIEALSYSQAMAELEAILKEIEAEAEVVWCCQTNGNGRDSFTAAPGMGLRFIEVSKGEESLERFFETMPAG